MHNASGSNENAIAENNGTGKDDYSRKVLFERTITDKIIEEATRGLGKIVILTGHAGDGKTKILQDIVRRCTGREMDPEKLMDEFISANNQHVHYVKDMSEHEKTEQIDIFRKAIQAVKRNESVILISNTGPLFHVLQEIGMEEEKMIELLDTTTLKEYQEDMEGYIKVPILVANLALFDNSDIIGKYLEKVLQEELWSPCKTCEKREYCPMCFNQENMRENKEQLISFSQWYYRWNFEHGERFTVRQILAHLSYSITGNLQCENIGKLTTIGNQKRKLYNTYSNLFFGYHEKNGKSVLDLDARQIKPISFIQKQMLDAKKIPVEYELFVQNNWKIFGKSMREVIESIYWVEDKKEYYRVIKRAYYMYHQRGEKENGNIQTAVFSEMFQDFMQMQKKDASPKALQFKMQKLTFSGLAILFMGGIQKEDDKIYLTTRRRGTMLQPVQISQGVIHRSDLKVELKERVNVTNGKQEKFVELQYNDVAMELTLPVLEYFYSLEQGMIQNKIDPKLSQGVEKIKAKLYRSNQKNKKSREDGFTVIYATGYKFKNAKVIVDENQIWIES